MPGDSVNVSPGHKDWSAPSSSDGEGGNVIIWIVSVAAPQSLEAVANTIDSVVISKVWPVLPSCHSISASGRSKVIVSSSPGHNEGSAPRSNMGASGSSVTTSVSNACPQLFSTSTEMVPGEEILIEGSVLPSCHNHVFTLVLTGERTIDSPGHKAISEPSTTSGAGPASITWMVSASIPQELVTVSI